MSCSCGHDTDVHFNGKCLHITPEFTRGRRMKLPNVDRVRSDREWSITRAESTLSGTSFVFVGEIDGRNFLVVDGYRHRFYIDTDDIEYRTETVRRLQGYTETKHIPIYGSVSTRPVEYAHVHRNICGTWRGVETVHVPTPRKIVDYMAVPEFTTRMADVEVDVAYPMVYACKSPICDCGMPPELAPKPVKETGCKCIIL